MAEIFFSKPQNQKKIRAFYLKLDQLVAEEQFEKDRDKVIKIIIGFMLNRPEEWDNLCGSNIEWIGETFLDHLNESDLSKQSLDKCCALAFRFLFEFYLSIPGDLSIDAAWCYNFVKKNLSQFSDDSQEVITFSIQEMPISIFKQVANSDAINSLKEFNSIAHRANDLKREWDLELEGKIRKVQDIKESLDTYENAFNFVGLYDGFNEISREKEKEKDSIALWLKVLGGLVLLPFVLEIGVLLYFSDNLAKVKELLLLSVFPTFSFAAVVIYYFRVLLFNYKSIKSQLLQIELRKTLCRFIQHYSTYSSEIKKDDAGSLEKFENIIFSNIVSDDDKLPSTYDGIEQLTKLFKSAK